MSAARHLPAGWVSTTLGEVAQWGSGGTPSRSHPEFFGGSIPWIKTGELGPRTISLTEEHLTAEGLSSSSAKLFPRGAVAVAMYGATIGRASILGVEAATNQACAVGIPLCMSSQFLHHYLVSQADALADAGRGGAQPNISQGVVRSWPIGLPPLREQDRIVDALDEMLSGNDAATAELFAAKRKLALYRQSLLKSAVEGALTAEWRRVARRSTKALDIPDDWRWSTIGELAIIVRGASPRPAGDPRYFGGSIPWITVGSLTADDQMYLSAVEQFVTEAGRDRSRWIDPGTLLLTNSGATLGVPKITKIGGCINDGSVALLGLDDLLKTYLYWFLRTQTASLRALNQGAAQPNLNTGIVRSIRVPVPPPEEMQVICSMVEQEIEQARSQTEAIDRTLILATAQRQNILRAAFSGQLVPQDPNDEPASLLLERIRAQRDAAADKPAARRPRKSRITA